MWAATINRDFGITQDELNYYIVISEANENESEENEIGCVLPSLEGGVENLDDLRVMNYEDTMASRDKEKNEKMCRLGIPKMDRLKLWKAVPK